MPERLTQTERFARLVTPLSDDALVLVKLEATEAISENFEWRVSCLLNEGEAALDPEQIIGQMLHVEVDTDSGAPRLFPGLCTDVRFRGWRGDYMYYELVLRPWTWLLTQETRSRIFHDLSVNEIIRDVFTDFEISHFEFRLQRSFQPIPYCTQYRETTYDFISRLMERYGLFFFFEFEKDKHRIIIVDSQAALPDISEYKALRFQPVSEIGIRQDRLFGWHKDSRLRPSIYEVDDYNYERPNTKLDVARNAKDKPRHGHGDLRKYHYPASHSDQAGGQQLADVLIDGERADAERKFAYGYAPLIRAGGVFTLTDHPVKEENTRHFAVRARHSVFVQHFRSGTGAKDGGFGRPGAEIEPETDQYEGEYEIVDAARAYRTLPKTPWPRIYGAQTATVIKEKNAPADEEIDVDKEGRILVQFHWKDTKVGPSSSCRVRVAQIWAGAQWGGVWIPRVGMEVVVDFLEGNPDEPLVTGAVYNGKNKPPIDFPADKTKSTIKSNSSKGGAGFNELRFEDKKDAEEIYIHAERDRVMEIENNDKITIGGSQIEKIAGSRTFELTGGDETVTLKGAPGTKDKDGTSITASGHRTTTLEMGDETLTVQKGKRTTTIKMDDTRTIQSGNDVETIDMGNQTTTIKLGNQTTKISAGKGDVSAMQSYEIKVGGSSIKITPMSIELKAMTIKLQASMMLEAKGMMTKVEGSAMVTVKGGMVMIN